jgi:hypothetical protein
VCGQSQEDKANNHVCDVRADIRTQVDELRGLTLSSASVDGVRANLSAIRQDLGKMEDAPSDLDDDRRKQVQAANQAFEAQVKSIAQNVGRGVFVAGAQTQLKSALGQLADSYKQTLAPIDCE